MCMAWTLQNKKYNWLWCNLKKVTICKSQKHTTGCVSPEPHSREKIHKLFLNNWGPKFWDQQCSKNIYVSRKYNWALATKVPGPLILKRQSFFSNIYLGTGDQGSGTCNVGKKWKITKYRTGDQDSGTCNVGKVLEPVPEPWSPVIYIYICFF